MEAEQNNGLITQVALPYALLLLHMPDFLICIFYNKAGMHVITLWSSLGQHKDTSNISRATTILILLYTLLVYT